MAIETSGQGTEATTDSLRCPECGALNPAGAEWCGQCVRSFLPPPEPATTVTDLRPSHASPDSIEAYFAESLDPSAGAGSLPPGTTSIIDENDPLGLSSVYAPPPPAGPANRPDAGDRDEHIAPIVALHPDVRRGAFSVSGRDISWTCRVCGEANPIEADDCSICGASLAETMRPPARSVTGDPNTAALYSLFFPGAGHAYLGLWAQGISRGILSSWVLLVSAFLLFGGGGKLAASIFVLASVALWIVTAHDAYREANHESSLVLLQGRRFLYVTIGLLCLLFMMLLVGAASVAR
jgi:ribosomal protein L40E